MGMLVLRARVPGHGRADAGWRAHLIAIFVIVIAALAVVLPCNVGAGCQDDGGNTCIAVAFGDGGHVRGDKNHWHRRWW